MPQLATESFFSQYFWLFVTLCLFHYVVTNEVIPHMSLTFKARTFQVSSVEETLVNANVESRDAIFASFPSPVLENNSEAGSNSINIEGVNISSIKSLKL